jgi:hypothetical protein
MIEVDLRTLVRGQVSQFLVICIVGNVGNVFRTDRWITTFATVVFGPDLQRYLPRVDGATCLNITFYFRCRL